LNSLSRATCYEEKTVSPLQHNQIGCLLKIAFSTFKLSFHQFVIARLTLAFAQEHNVLAKWQLSICKLLLEKLKPHLEDTDIKRIYEVSELLPRTILTAPPPVTRDRIRLAILATAIDRLHILLPIASKGSHFEATLLQFALL
jgi:hypothetical protein